MKNGVSPWTDLNVEGRHIFDQPFNGPTRPFFFYIEEPQNLFRFYGFNDPSKHHSSFLVLSMRDHPEKQFKLTELGLDMVEGKTIDFMFL
jgi:hypothetical protein